MKFFFKKLKELENGDRIVWVVVVEVLGNLNFLKEEIENSEKEENREERLFIVFINRWCYEIMLNV